MTIGVAGVIGDIAGQRCRRLLAYALTALDRLPLVTAGVARLIRDRHVHLKEMPA